MYQINMQNKAIAKRKCNRTHTVRLSEEFYHTGVQISQKDADKCFVTCSVKTQHACGHNFGTSGS